MKYVWWDKCNKWLYIGTKQGQANQFVIMFDNWLNWLSKYPCIREWTLFQITWDNGAWWGLDLSCVEKKQSSKMNGKYIEATNYTERSGDLNCFFQVTILGIGLRYWYSRKMTVIMPDKIEL